MLQQIPGNDQNPSTSHLDGCRTEKLNSDASFCLAGQKRYQCNYSLLFGDGYLCTHPHHCKFR